MASRDGEEGLGIVFAHDAMAYSVRTCEKREKNHYHAFPDGAIL